MKTDPVEFRSARHGRHLAPDRRPAPAATIEIMVRYQIDVGSRRSHTFAVELRLDDPAAEQRLSLPVWIPGSYLVREFARHVSGVAAEQGGNAAFVQQL